MKSLDTNMLLYAINVDCAEHEPARDLVDRALSESDEWIVADQVYFELYGLLFPLSRRQRRSTGTACVPAGFTVRTSPGNESDLVRNEGGRRDVGSEDHEEPIAAAISRPQPDLVCQRPIPWL